MSFALVLPVGFLCFLGLGALMKQVPFAIPAAYLACSLLSIGMYAYDKSKARREEWRTPDRRCTFSIYWVAGSAA